MQHVATVQLFLTVHPGSFARFGISAQSDWGVRRGMGKSDVVQLENLDRFFSSVCTWGYPPPRPARTGQ